MVQSKTAQRNALHELGYKIFLDRYAQKDMTRASLAVGDTVIVVVNSKTGQREIGTVQAIKLPKVTVQLLDGETVERDVENVDKPLETDPGQMMDRVAAGIAAIESTPELQQQWTENFRWLLEDWKFVPAGRILTAAGTDQRLTYYNCMPPDQEVLTAEGYKPIAEVKVGDLVVTHKNRLRPVLHKFERETEEDLYIIRPKKVGYDDLRLTGDHKVYIIRSEWVNKHKSRDGLRLQQEPAWIPAKELKPGDYVAVAFNGEECPPETIFLQDYLTGYENQNGKLFKTTKRGTHGYVQEWGTHYDINDRLELDEDLSYLFGRWLGNGCVTHRTGTDIPSGIKIVFALDEKAEAEEIARIVETKFGVEAALKLSSTERWYDLWVNSMPIGQFFKAFLGYYSYGKRIPEPLMHLPEKLALALLRGLFSADGYISDNKLGIVLSNRTLAVQIHQMLLRLGYLFSIRENTHRLGRVPAYRVQATSNECGPLFEHFFDVTPPAHETDLKYYFEYEGSKWLRIDEIAVEDYSGTVLDIEVAEDHSFVSAGVVVSNCYVIPSPKDSRGGIIETLRQMTEIMSRGGGVGINVSSLRPRHAYVKGVNGRSSGAVSWGALYSFVTGLIEQGGSRRGALMLILNDWHPDVFDFISSKRKAGQITNANISVGVSDKLMAAIEADADWDLVFPDSSHPDYDELWDGDLNKWVAAGRGVIKYRTVKAREIWDAIIESAWASAEPGVFFNERYNKMSNSWYYASIISTNPCGEQGLPAFGVCNLGAINLAKFYNPETNDVDWDDLDRAARYATRFLDNVIDSTPYFFEENEKQQLGERRVGLNNMGLAELMINLGIRYGSDESVAFIDKLYGFLARAIYETSIELAAEKGAFPMFEAEKFLQSGFMQSMPEDIREKVRQHGVRNVTLTTQAPTGCVAPDTLISTSTGLRPIVELGDPQGEQWQIMTRDVHTDEGLRTTSHFYINGFAPVKKISTQRGFNLTATHNHRVRIIDADGNYIWRRMDELQIGDRVVLKKGTLGKGEVVKLTSVEQGNRALSQLPNQITPEFAEMLGLYMGDGYTKTRGGIHIVVAKQDPDLLEHVQHLLQQVWGEDRQVPVEDRPGCWVANLTGYYIPRFFEANNLLKPKGNHGEGAEGAFIPSKILQAGREAVAAFLRGLFEADGSVHRGTITLASTSKTLIDQVQIALLGLGIVSTSRELPDQESSIGLRTKYELRILNRREAEKFAQVVGFISERKRNKLAHLGNVSDRGDSIAVPALCQEFYVESKGLRNEVRQKIIGLVSNGALTQQFVKETVKTYPMLENTRLAQLVDKDVFLDEVASIEDGACNTYDLSVPDNKTYIANGFVSHNTTGTMVNTSTGIEPFFSWVYYRKSRLGLHEEQVPLVKEWFEAHPGETQLPDYFVTAMDLTPEEHVKVQGAIQRWVDSSISKTANVPNHYTVEQVSDLYKYMYEIGCKGGTIYRDGSRDEQVLMLKGDERAESEMANKDKAKAAPAAEKPAEKIEQVATPHRVYPRPKRLSGVTVSRKTPFGTAYITMNSDEHGNPFEVFITIGKAGSDLQADAEGLGRMLSLQLRTTAPQNRMEMLKLIIDQLQGIGGSRSVGMGPNRVTSLPDAVAGALVDHYLTQPQQQQLNLPLVNGNGTWKATDSHAEPAAPPTHTNGTTHGYQSRADICPECGTVSLIRIEGCEKCDVCGYSRC